MYVKKKVAWPHEAILGGVNRTRLTYDQLTMAQWVQGFCRNIVDEKDEVIREKMVTYMGILWKMPLILHGKGQKLLMQYFYVKLKGG